MIRSRSILLTCVLAAGCAGLVANPAHAGRPAYLLHIQGRFGAGSHSLDLAVPWKTSKGGSPFDFTADVSDNVGLDRLRRAWSTLQHLPEGRDVAIETSSETVRAWRRGGYLVLEPHRRDESEVCRVKIPEYIVTTILAHEGRLTDEDIDHLMHERGKVTIVKVNSEKGELSVWVDRSTADI